MVERGIEKRRERVSNGSFGQTLTGGLRQYMWCPLSHMSQSSIFSPSPFLRQILQRAFRADFDQMILDSRVDMCRNIYKHAID